MNPLFTLCNLVFAGTLGVFGDYERSGLESIPKTGPLLVVANHQSNLDPPIVARSIGRRTFFLAKRELFGNPLFSLFLAMWGAHPLRRGEADIAAYQWVLAMLREPRGSVTLFPEGTRHRGGMGRARSGPASVALRSGATVLPVGITGSESLGSVFRTFFPTAKIRVNIGKPFTVEDPGGDRRSALQTLTTEMMGRVAALLPETYRGVYAGAATAPRVFTRDVVPTGANESVAGQSAA